MFIIPLWVWEQAGQTERRAMMSSTALAPEPPTNQPNREIFWLSAEQEAEADRPALVVG